MPILPLDHPEPFTATLGVMLGINLVNHHYLLHSRRWITRRRPGLEVIYSPEANLPHPAEPRGGLFPESRRRPSWFQQHRAMPSLMRHEDCDKNTTIFRVEVKVYFGDVSSAIRASSFGSEHADPRTTPDP